MFSEQQPHPFLAESNQSTRWKRLIIITLSTVTVVSLIGCGAMWARSTILSPSSMLSGRKFSSAHDDLRLLQKPRNGPNKGDGDHCYSKNGDWAPCHDDDTFNPTARPEQANPWDPHLLNRVHVTVYVGLKPSTQSIGHRLASVLTMAMNASSEVIDFYLPPKYEDWDNSDSYLGPWPPPRGDEGNGDKKDWYDGGDGRGDNGWEWENEGGGGGGGGDKGGWRGGGGGGGGGGDKGGWRGGGGGGGGGGGWKGGDDGGDDWEGDGDGWDGDGDGWDGDGDGWKGGGNGWRGGGDGGGRGGRRGNKRSGGKSRESGNQTLKQEWRDRHGEHGGHGRDRGSRRLGEIGEVAHPLPADTRDSHLLRHLEDMFVDSDHQSYYQLFYIRRKPDIVDRGTRRWWWRYTISYNCFSGDSLEPVTEPVTGNIGATLLALVNSNLDDLQLFLSRLKGDADLKFTTDKQKIWEEDDEDEGMLSDGSEVAPEGDLVGGSSKAVDSSDVEPLDFRVWDWERYLGLALFLSVTSGTMLLVHIGATRQRRRLRKQVWSNLASEEGVMDLLRTGWVLKGNRMEVYDKSKLGYRDEDSILIGGFEQKEPIVGTDITVPQGDSVNTPRSLSSRDFLHPTSQANAVSQPLTGSGAASENRSEEPRNTPT